MLLNLTVNNWSSFSGESSLVLTNSLERQHSQTLGKIPGFRSKKVLPVAAVYGGNASGKTNLFSALSALQQMVITDPGVDGTVPVVPFLLDADSRSAPVLLDITFLASEKVFRLTVEATRDTVLYESLELLTERKSVDIYERDSEGQEYFAFDDGFFSDYNHVYYAAKSTRANQLFLQSAVAQNIDELRVAYDWFDSALELIGVESQAWNFASYVTDQEGFLDYASDALASLDTGVVGLRGSSIGLDNLPSSSRLRKDIDELKPDELLTLVGGRTAGDYGFDMITVRQEDGEPQAEVLHSLHIGPDGVEHAMPLSMESSGTQRLMGLMPMLFDLSRSSTGGTEKVYVVDELDRCLHTMLTFKLIEDFLTGCGPDTRKQILFTTHDLLLMDQSLMRRDEMFIVQRDGYGRSELIGLSEYDGIRYDKDLIRSYLDGRFGGIPMLREA